MANSSKILLDLEAEKSPAESKFLFCMNHDFPRQPKPTKYELPQKKPIITSVPKSQVLGKLKDFLPVMSDANKKLQLAAMDNAKVFDIESLEDNDSAHIEMDLMLGVADLHTPEAIAAAESAINGIQPVLPFATTSNSDEDTDEYDDSESDSESTYDDEDGGENKRDSDKHDQGNDGIELACSLANTKRAKSVCKESSEDLGNAKSSKRPKIVELS
ncbi:uncharacterized protein LOC108197609 [Daucus carota subsp. sativus]|uniref:uncharacterized protein LOC108197609 n=1 Tax=Daucus carota subsp. sativus TaxID=79200 RepID=UPI0007E21A28|nr:PREDICTED: uncharacterized protein LOC108197609 [Daucus carota subsp. sativus]